jgi:hypothetical protein
VRAQAKEGVYKFTFIHNGVALVAPAVEHVAATAGTNGAVNGRATSSSALTGSAYAPPVAGSASAASANQTAALKANAAKAGEAAKAASEKVGPIANFAGRFLYVAGEVIPGSFGDELKAMSMRTRSAQAKMARTQYEVSDVTGDVSELGGMSKQVGSTAAGAVAKTSGAVTTAPPPSRYSATPAPAPSGAFALQPSKSGSSNGAMAVTGAPTATPKWVETPPINPGDTIGVDLFVQSEKGKSRGKRVALRLMVIASEAEGAKPSVDEVTVTL